MSLRDGDSVHFDAMRMVGDSRLTDSFKKEMAVGLLATTTELSALDGQGNVVAILTRDDDGGWSGTVTNESTYIASVRMDDGTEIPITIRP